MCVHIHCLLIVASNGDSVVIVCVLAPLDFFWVSLPVLPKIVWCDVY